MRDCIGSSAREPLTVAARLAVDQRSSREALLAIPVATATGPQPLGAFVHVVTHPRDDMRMQWSSMESLHAEVKLAEKRLKDSTMYAPFDGMVAQKHVSAGQFVKDNVAILTIVKTYPLRLRVGVPETAAGLLRIGAILTFTTDALPGSEFQAVVREMNPTLDASSRSLIAEARITRPDARLKPGMFAQVKLGLERGADAVMVPKQAIYSIAGLSKVFAIRDGKAVEFKITPGDERDGWVELPTGSINAGDMVAITAQPALVNGTPVKVTMGRS